MAVLMNFLNNAISSDKFDFFKDDNAFTAELSDLKGFDLRRQIYDDACDIGFGIRSKRTGKVAKFYLHQEQTDAEGDIQYWTYLPCPEDARKPEIAVLSVTIFND